MRQKIFKNISRITERGQAIVMVAGAMVALIAILGLMVDGGILLIEYGRVKRGVDAASVAAAAQFRKGYTEADLITAGEELMHFNQADAVVTVQTCNGVGVNHDESLCSTGTDPKRKLVRVTATRTVKFGFLPVIGINSTSITASAVGEAASVDMVIVLDTSSSMAFETTGDGNEDNAFDAGPPGDDPVACNADPVLRCEPMGKVKDVAKDFVDKLFFPYDRVSVITSTSQVYEITGAESRNPYLLLPFSDNANPDGTPNTEIQDAIDNVIVLEPAPCAPWWSVSEADKTIPGPCILTWDEDNPTTFWSVNCAPYIYELHDGSSCGPSNIGGALYLAGDQFAYARPEAFWVVINLFGGPANATNSPIPGGPDFGYCPNPNYGPPILCRDIDPTSSNRHHIVGGVADPLYDADDYARDAADFVASPSTGQNATIFSICMGDPCKQFGGASFPDRESADRLGHYMAETAGDDLTANPPVIANHGLYFYAVDSSGLAPIFNAIAANIFTRISQ